jgi:hypothetical protein
MAWEWPHKKPKEEGQGTNTPDNIEVKPGDPPKESQEDLIKRLFAENQTTFTQKFTEIEGKIESLKVKPPEKPADPAQPISVLDNEDAAFAQRIGPVAYQNYQMQARLTLMDIKEEYPREVWQRFQKEISEALGKETVMYQSNPQCVRNVCDMIIGRAAKDNGFRYDSKGKKFFLEDASQVDAQGNPQAEAEREYLDFKVAFPPNRDGKQKVVSRKSFLEGMGVTPEQSKKAMDKLQVVS